MNAPNPTTLDAKAAIAAMGADVAVIVLTVGAFLFWDEPWWLGLFLGWLAGAFVGAAAWALVRAVRRGNASDRRPGLEADGILAELGGVVSHARATSQHLRRLP